MSKGEEVGKILLDFEDPTLKHRRILDAAYWVKGCSSLGLLRCAVLVRDGKKGRIALLDVKEAIAATAPSAHSARTPHDCAKRVVTGAKSLSPNLGDRMVASHVLDKAVFVREIAPQDMKIEIDRMSGGEIQAMARCLGGVVGHARSTNGIEGMASLGPRTANCPQEKAGCTVVALDERYRPPLYR